MIYTVLDIEADGLIKDATKIHCLSYRNFTSDFQLVNKGSITDYKEIENFISESQCLVGHNIIRYDIPVLKKILNIEINKFLIDTLGLSWYLYSTEIKNKILVPRKKHGLESWGEYYNVPKPVINDWKNLDIKDYINRCETDVLINSLLWKDEMEFLVNLYGGEDSQIFRIINYLNFKLDCAREQEENPCYIDRELCEKTLKDLEEEIEKKITELSEHMPVQKFYKTITKPEKFYKKDGTLSAAGEKWLQYMREYNLNSEIQSFEMLEKIERGNPNSIQQVKDWLFSLGWKPTIYKEVKSKTTGKVSDIPQITDDDGNICSNIRAMYKDYPYLENLENLALMNHRKGIFESFLGSIDSENRAVASIGGFTNSLRMQHRKPLVNLPKVGTYLGKEIRDLIKVPNEDYLICGSDVHALEDTTKQHYMYFFDPEYVNQMRVPGFDPHLDIALLAGLMSKEEVERYKELKKKGDKTEEEQEEFLSLSEIRYAAKTLNFSAVYGAGPPKIAKSLGKSLEFAKNLHSTYWKRNKAVKQVAANVITKRANGQLWLFNPISKFWYSLRVEKDIFSVLNQGTGSYVEDRWIFHMRKKGIKMILQYHDEVATYLKKEDKELYRQYITQSMEEVNQELKLNVPITVSIDFGLRYSEIH